MISKEFNVNCFITKLMSNYIGNRKWLLKEKARFDKLGIETSFVCNDSDYIALIYKNGGFKVYGSYSEAKWVNKDSPEYRSPFTSGKYTEIDLDVRVGIINRREKKC